MLFFTGVDSPEGLRTSICTLTIIRTKFAKKVFSRALHVAKLYPDKSNDQIER